MPLQATSGAASYDAFGGGVAVVPNYIEDVFSTYLYTGNGSTQTITNGIDLSTKGGLVWLKSRSVVENHILTDSARGVAFFLRSNLTNAQDTNSPSLISAFNNNGFGLGVGYAGVNGSGESLVSWTFRKQPKFFDIVTYTGDGTNQVLNHNLGSAPGFIIVKATSTTGDWAVWHRSTTFKQGYLNTTADFTSAVSNFPTNAATSTTFSVRGPTGGGVISDVGVTYVAYLFAHDAGGFGLTGTDNVISCGSFTTDVSGNATVNLGYEPQWLLFKPTNEVNSWVIVDTMRGYSLGASDTGVDARLRPNTDDAESTSSNVGYPTATGFYVAASGSVNFIYIAIRRGPMKVPTTGTSVFEPAAYTGNGTNPRTVGTLQVTDLAINMNRPDSGDVPLWVDRLRGPERYLYSSGTAAEAGGLTGWLLGQSGQTINGVRNTSPTTYIDWLFRRAPSFMDVVCYTGDGTGTRAINHNLGVTPTFMIEKPRVAASQWVVYHSALTYTKYLYLNSTAASDTNSNFWGADPTSSTFSVGAFRNDAGPPAERYVVYLFATCAGVSKVGSYTGTGTTQTINCGFTAGARFVLIKRTDSTGDWYVWDSARGIVAGNDPYLLINTNDAEVTGTDYIDTAASGFEISSTAPAAINANGGSFIFLAIA